MESSVYVLFSVLYEKHYTGYTTDLDGPMLSHNELGKGGPQNIVPGNWFTRKNLFSNKKPLHEKNR